MKLTNDRKNLLLNICLAYTSKEEILHAAEKMQSSNDEITVCDLSRNMYGGDMPDPDILIRTSGETRLSDFLTWQSSATMLSFLNVMWPDFSIWHLLTTVLQYQHQFEYLEKCRQNLETIDRTYQDTQPSTTCSVLSGKVDSKKLHAPPPTEEGVMCTK